jgi:hypothetical protein
MAKIYLINVGANTSDSNRARSPIFQDGKWIYVPFIHKSGKPGENFPPATKQYTSKCEGIKCHLDPDWEHLTYGDCLDEPRSKALTKVQKNEILLFWALLWRTNQSDSVFESKEKGWYLIGAVRVEYALKSSEQIQALAPSIRDRALLNAHVEDGRIKKGDVVFVGSPNLRHSRRFERAVDWEVYRDGGLMQRVVSTAKGEEIQWHKQPKWNSVTRACRAILDLDKKNDRHLAELLARRIEKHNPEFALIDGL